MQPVGKSSSSSSTDESKIDLSDYRKEKEQTISDERLIAICEALNTFKINNSKALSNLKLKKIEFNATPSARIARAVRPLMTMIGLGGVAIVLWPLLGNQHTISFWKNSTLQNVTSEQYIYSQPRFSDREVIALLGTGMSLLFISMMCCIEKKISGKLIECVSGVDVNATLEEFKKSKWKIQAEDTRAEQYLKLSQKINACHVAKKNIEDEGASGLTLSCQEVFDTLQKDKITFKLNLSSDINRAERLISDMTGSLESAVNDLIPKPIDEQALLEID